jgi:hypothetical protein
MQAIKGPLLLDNKNIFTSKTDLEQITVDNLILPLYFNTLSPSPLAICRIQKPRNLTYF